MKYDPNKQAVYRAEDRAWGRMFGRGDSRVDYLQRTADHILASPTWTALRPSDYLLLVEVAKGGRTRARIRTDRARRAALVTLPRGGRTVPILLHELAHAAAPGEAAHGPLFCEAYCLLVRDYYGADIAERLRVEFETEGVL